MPKIATICLTLALALSTALVAADVKVKTAQDKNFNFKGIKTYAWHPEGIGDVKVLQNTTDDAADLKRRFEPIFVESMTKGFASRNLALDTSGSPDLYVTYYLLIGPGNNSQQMGQFLPPISYWGLPAFAPATSSLQIYEQGSLVIDVSSVAQGTIVWRGLAVAEVDRGRTQDERAQRIRDGIASLMKKFPSTK